MSSEADKASNTIPVAFTQTRAEWMATSGYQIYEALYLRATEADPPAHVSHLNEGSPYRNLIKVAETTAAHLTETEFAGAEPSPLKALTAEIFHYTSADEVAANKTGRLYVHVEDGIKFAHKAAIGLAIDTIVNLEPDLIASPELPAAVSNVLQNPQFTPPLQVLATTGFDAIGNNRSPKDYDAERCMEKIKRAYDYNPEDPIVRVADGDIDATDLSAAELAIDPAMTASLHAQLRAQNRSVRTDPDYYLSSGGGLLDRHRGKPGFSKGCPVAHGLTMDRLRAYLSETIDLTFDPKYKPYDPWDIYTEYIETA